MLPGALGLSVGLGPEDGPRGSGPRPRPILSGVVRRALSGGRGP